jgi:hypothetical protein
MCCVEVSLEWGLKIFDIVVEKWATRGTSCVVDQNMDGSRN